MWIYLGIWWDEMKSLKLKMKVGVIWESCDNGCFFSLVLCSISHFSLAVLRVFWLFLSHLLYCIHFAAPPWFLFLSALSFVCPVSKIFFPFSLSSFSAVPANVLIQTVICIVIPIFSADCWLYKKQSRSRKCQSSCAWVSLWREQENPPGNPSCCAAKHGGPSAPITVLRAVN